jgi:hypothetical protein
MDNEFERFERCGHRLHEGLSRGPRGSIPSGRSILSVAASAEIACARPLEVTTTVTERSGRVLTIVAERSY